MVEASCLPAHQLLHLLHTPRSSYIEMMIEYIPLETVGYGYFDEYSEKVQRGERGSFPIQNKSLQTFCILNGHFGHKCGPIR